MRWIHEYCRQPSRKTPADISGQSSLCVRPNLDVTGSFDERTVNQAIVVSLRGVPRVPSLFACNISFSIFQVVLTDAHDSTYGIFMETGRERSLFSASIGNLYETEDMASPYWTAQGWPRYIESWAPTAHRGWRRPALDETKLHGFCEIDGKLAHMSDP